MLNGNRAQCGHLIAPGGIVVQRCINPQARRERNRIYRTLCMPCLRRWCL